MSELLKIVVKELDERLASNIEVIDLRGISPFTDYFVIAGANNQRLANAMINGVIEKALKTIMIIGRLKVKAIVIGYY